MRLTAQFLRARAKGSLKQTEYIDLSNLEIVFIESLNSCPKLKTLILRDNSIECVENLEECLELWYVDLGNNKIANLEGFSRFVALGTLVLSNNYLTWPELAKIRHLHILNLCLHGNKQLEKDPYYRIHVIDCLPNIWMLDGRIVTSAERLQVEYFFNDTALTENPVRHKLKSSGFTPSKFKKIEVTGIFGIKATHCMMRFAKNGALNIDIDRRRLKYLAHNLQEDMVLLNRKLKFNWKILKDNPDFLVSLLEFRPEERERCNMLLLLLVTSLEFAFPVSLVKSTIEIAKLDKIGNTRTMDLFLLPRNIRCLVVCLLLSAVKIDNDENEDGGLYNRLYLCLYYTVSELAKLCYSDRKPDTSNSTKQSNVYKDYRCLLASEIVQLLCIVPTFFQFIDKDIGMINLLATATDDYDCARKVVSVMDLARNEGVDAKKLYETAAEYVLRIVQQHAQTLFKRTTIKPHPTQADSVLGTKRALPRRPQSSPLYKAEFHTSGRKSPDKRPPRVISAKPVKFRVPVLGERILLGPQQEAKIISLPEHDIALVQMDIVPVPNGAVLNTGKHIEDHFVYVDMGDAVWDEPGHYWRPKGSIGDRITFEQAQVSLGTPTNTKKKIGPNENDVLTDKKGNTKEFPRPMSSLLCEKLDIKMELNKNVLTGSVLLATGSNKNEQQQLTESEDQLFSKTRRKRSKTNESQLEGITLDSPLYDSIRSAVRNVTGQMANTGLRVTPSSGSLTKPAESSSIEEPSSAKGKKTHTDTLAVEDDRASLLSGDETELHDLHSEIFGPTTTKATCNTSQDSRPQSLNSKYSGNVKMASRTSTPDSEKQAANPVVIRLPDDMQEDVVESTRTELLSTKNIHIPPPNSPHGFEHHMIARQSQRNPKLLRGSPRVGFVSKPPRPVTAVEAYRFIIDQNSHRSPRTEDDITMYQKQRTEAWKRTTAEQQAAKEQTIQKSEETPGRPKTPPPQRSVTPENQHPVPSQNATQWLGAGRNLHQQEVNARPPIAFVPGYIREGFERPYSGGAVRSFHRARIPHIETPSSLAYEAIAAAGIDRRSFHNILSVTSPELEVSTVKEKYPANSAYSTGGVRSWYLPANANLRPRTLSQHKRPYEPKLPPDVICEKCIGKLDDCLHGYERQLAEIHAEHLEALTPTDSKVDILRY